MAISGPTPGSVKLFSGSGWHPPASYTPPSTRVKEPPVNAANFLDSPSQSTPPQDQSSTFTVTGDVSQSGGDPTQFSSDTNPLGLSANQTPVGPDAGNLAALVDPSGAFGQGMQSFTTTVETSLADVVGLVVRYWWVLAIVALLWFFFARKKG